VATIVKTDSGTWKALIRKTGWPSTAKTFRTKRDAEDWSRRTEDEMVRGAYIQRAGADRLTIADALTRYLAEITPTKRPSSQVSDRQRAVILTKHLGGIRSPPSLQKSPPSSGTHVSQAKIGKTPRASLFPVPTTRFGWTLLCSVTCSPSQSKNGV
jgi:hypothetical protein